MTKNSFELTGVCPSIDVDPVYIFQKLYIGAAKKPTQNLRETISHEAYQTFFMTNSKTPIHDTGTRLMSFKTRIII